jgi:hypothetical protein
MFCRYSITSLDVYSGYGISRRSLDRSVTAGGHRGRGRDRAERAHAKGCPWPEAEFVLGYYGIRAKKPIPATTSRRPAWRAPANRRHPHSDRRVGASRYDSGDRDGPVPRPRRHCVRHWSAQRLLQLAPGGARKMRNPIQPSGVLSMWRYAVRKPGGHCPRQPIQGLEGELFGIVFALAGRPSIKSHSPNGVPISSGGQRRGKRLLHKRAFDRF